MFKKELKNPIILIVVALLGYFIVNNIALIGQGFTFIIGILSPFILGCIIAFIFNIPMSFFAKNLDLKNKKIERVVSIILAIIVVLSILVIVITLVVPELINVINLLINNLPYYIENTLKFMANVGVDINEMNVNVDTLKTEIINQLPNLLTYSVSLVTNVAKSISDFFIAVIFAIYILADKERLSRQVSKLMDAYLPKKKVKTITESSKVASNIFKKFFTVQCFEATILGVLCILGMLILRLPYAVTIGVLVGVTALIPVVGAFIGVGVGAILILSVNPMQALIFIIFVLILQQVEGNVIYPRVVGKSVGLPGIWVLAAVVLGGSIGGIGGMLLGVPIATTLYYLLRTNVNGKLKKETAL